MQFSNLLAIATFAAGVLASPSPANDATAADPKVVDLWKNKNFLGLKFTGSAKAGTCKNLPGDFANNVSSGKAEPGFRCTIWDNKNCEGRGFSFNASPGAASFPSWIDNKASRHLGCVPLCTCALRLVQSVVT